MFGTWNIFSTRRNSHEGYKPLLSCFLRELSWVSRCSWTIWQLIYVLNQKKTKNIYLNSTFKFCIFFGSSRFMLLDRFIHCNSLPRKKKKYIQLIFCLFQTLLYLFNTATMKPFLLNYSRQHIIANELQWVTWQDGSYCVWKHTRAST